MTQNKISHTQKRALNSEDLYNSLLSLHSILPEDQQVNLFLEIKSLYHYLFKTLCISHTHKKKNAEYFYSTPFEKWHEKIRLYLNNNPTKQSLSPDLQRLCSENYHFEKKSVPIIGAVFQYIYNNTPRRYIIETISTNREYFKNATELETKINKINQHKLSIVQSNLRLVKSIALRSMYQSHNVQFMDLIQAGFMSLVKSIDTYQHEYGTKFSTNYAYTNIKEAINTEIIRTSSDIKGVPQIRRDIWKLNNTLEKERLHGKELTIEELSQKVRLTPAYITQLPLLNIKLESLNTPFGQDFSIEDTIASNDQNPEELTEHKHLHQLVIKAIENLEPRMKHIIEKRFGLRVNGQNPTVELTLEEVSKMYNISRERVRQIEFRAIRILKKELKIQRQDI